MVYICCYQYLLESPISPYRSRLEDIFVVEVFEGGFCYCRRADKPLVWLELVALKFSSKFITGGLAHGSKTVVAKRCYCLYVYAPLSPAAQVVILTKNMNSSADFIARTCSGRFQRHNLFRSSSVTGVPKTLVCFFANN